jgi:hypothetical protein
LPFSCDIAFSADPIQHSRASWNLKVEPANFRGAHIFVRFKFEVHFLSVPWGEFATSCLVANSSVTGGNQGQGERLRYRDWRSILLQ